MIKKFFTEDDNFNELVKINLKKIMNIDEIIKLEKNPTGWTNIVYKAETEDGNYYFRFPRDEFWNRTIVKDYEFCKFINGKTDFKTVDLKLGKDGQRYFSIHKEIEGQSLAEAMQEMSEEQIYNVSKEISSFMSQLHNLKYDKDSIFNIDSIGHDLADFIDELLKKHVSDEDIKFWNKDDFANSNDKECLVHGDLNASNILVDSNYKMKAVIDFGFGGYGNKYLDIARIIGRCIPEFKEPFIKTYENISNENLDRKYLDKIIDVWTNIDNSYINYMKKNGIM